MVHPERRSPSGTSPTPVRVALVGVGRWGANYLDVFAEIAGAKLVALCDRDPAALDRGAARISVDHTAGSLAELDRTSVDAVIIATPTDSHVRLACEAFEMGLHVLVEKPLAMTAADAATVAMAAERANRVLAVGYQMTHHPGHVALAHAVRGLGPIRHVRTVRFSVRRERQDPVLTALGPHDLATLTTLSNRSDFLCDGTDGDGINSLTARLRSAGTSLTAELQFGRGTPVRTTEVIAQDGTATLDEATGIVTVDGGDVFAGCQARPLDLQCADFIQKVTSGTRHHDAHLAGISRLMELVQTEILRVPREKWQPQASLG